MSATYTTLVGRMVTAPERQTFDSGATRVTFRVACTERRRGGQGWEDGDTLYIGVRCWRQLGDNVLASMSVGDPIVVHGKISTRSIEREGSRLSITEMEASAVGPDLRWATAEVTRTKAAAAGAPSGLPEMPLAAFGEAAASAETASDDPWAAVEQAAGEAADPLAAGDATSLTVGGNEVDGPEPAPEAEDRTAGAARSGRGGAAGRSRAEAAVGG